MKTSLEAPRAVSRGRACLTLSIAALVTVSLIAGCASDAAEALARPVSATPSDPPRAGEPLREPAISSTTSSVPEPAAAKSTDAGEPDASTAVVAPESITGATLPLRNATASPLLAEVDAAYSDAYSALLAAAAIPDEDHPALVATMADGQREQWRSVIRRLREDGLSLRPVEGRARWHRIEAIEVLSPDIVRLDVCRFDPDESVGPDGVSVATSEHPYRYLETIERADGRWLWAGREWVDPSDRYSDCALQ